jgi:hypothetical protein
MKAKTTLLNSAKAKGKPISDVPPTEEEVRRRAYEIFIGRGGQDGQELDDWVRAEQELKQERDSN